MKKKEKVDKGFELSYLNLSYRRRFIRSLLIMPFIILVIVLLTLSSEAVQDKTNTIRCIALAIVGAGQLTYDYIRWKMKKN